MPHELKVPEVGESIQEVQIGQWLVQEGQWADLDQDLVEIDTDKASLEVPSPIAGIVKEILKHEGDTAEVGEVIAYLQEAEKPAGQRQPGGADKPSPGSQGDAQKPQKETALASTVARGDDEHEGDGDAPRVTPAARRLLSKHALSPSEVDASGPGGRLLKEDVLRHVEAAGEGAGPAAKADGVGPLREEETVRMSLIRRRIAQRLVQAQQTAALLTTVNEIDMTEVIALRKKHRETFLEKYEVKLGFMSFFVKAAIEALKAYPEVNAEIREDSIVYRNYFDIGIAVGGGKGLVVPVLRNAETMSFAEIEQRINDLARRAQKNKINPRELAGGTFTISNGGVYGSLLSTPIVNPPQSGILGLHAIQDRPVALDGQVVIRPMMYVALTYDHRLVDGREAVSFLLRVKQIVEEPSRMLLEI